MNKKSWQIVLGVFIVLGILAGVYIYTDDATKTAEPNPEVTENSTKPIIDDQGGVQVAAVWVKSPPDSAEHKFQLQLNNHRWDFTDYYFKDNVVLKLNGNEISSSVVSENRKPDGHHLVSEIVVESQDFVGIKKGDELILIINSIMETPERIFTWSY